PKEDWEVKKLGEIGEFISTNSFSRDKLNYSQGEVFNIHYGDIHTRFRLIFDLEDERVPFINEDIRILTNVIPCKTGDLVIADASENEEDIGKAIEIGNLNGEIVVSGLHTIHFRPKENTFQLKFLGFVWHSSFVKTQILKESQGTKV